MIAAGLDNYQRGMDSHCNIKFCSFCDKYTSQLPSDIKQEMNQRESAGNAGVFSEPALLFWNGADRQRVYTTKIL